VRLRLDCVDLAMVGTHGLLVVSIEMMGSPGVNVVDKVVGWASCPWDRGDLEESHLQAKHFAVSDHLVENGSRMSLAFQRYSSGRDFQKIVVVLELPL
jgi:hypothetical protein